MVVVVLAALTAVGRTSAQEPTIESSAREGADTAERIARAIATFFDESKTPEERNGAIPPAVELAKEWMATYEFPARGGDLEAAGQVAYLADVLRWYVGPWFAVGYVTDVQERWLRVTEVELEKGTELGRREFASALHDLAFVLGAHVGLEEALEQLTDARLISVPHRQRAELVGLLTTRASLQRVNGRLRGAFEDLAAAEAIARTDDWQYAPMLAVRAYLEVDLGRIDVARARHREYASLAAAAPDRPELAIEHDMMTLALLLVGERPSTAKSLAEAFLRTHRDQLESTFEGRKQLQLAQHYDARAALALAREPGAIEKALTELARLTGPESLLSTSARAWTRIERVDGLLKLDRIDEAERVLESLSGSDRVVSWDSTSSTLHGAQIARRRLRIARLRDDERAVESAAADLRRAVDELIEAWQDMPLITGGIGFLHNSGRRDAIAEYVDVVTRSGSNEGLEQALRCLLAADACSTTAKQLGGGVRTPEELRAHCRESNCCIVWLLPGRDTVHQLFIDSDRIRHDRLDGLATAPDRLRSIWRDLERRPSAESEWPSTEVSDDLDWLSERVLPKWIREREAGDGAPSIVVIGAEAIGRVPIEVLPLTDGRPVGLVVPIQRAPSASALLALRDRMIERDSHGSKVPDATMFALSGVDHALPRIDLLVDEHRTLERAAGTRIELTSRRAADAAGFLRSMVRGESLFVAWTHGAFDATLSQPAGLHVAAADTTRGVEVLQGNTIHTALVAADRSGSILVSTAGPTAPDWIHDWIDRSNGSIAPRTEEPGASVAATPGDAGQITAPRVAFLASCGSARGHRREGDDIAGHLGGVFLGGGVAATVVSATRVDRDATMKFLVEWTGAFLGRGESAVDATLRARRSVSADERYRHPHFWAGFQLVGWGGVRKGDAPR